MFEHCGLAPASNQGRAFERGGRETANLHGWAMSPLRFTGCTLWMEGRLSAFSLFFPFLPCSSFFFPQTCCYYVLNSLTCSYLFFPVLPFSYSLCYLSLRFLLLFLLFLKVASRRRLHVASGGAASAAPWGHRTRLVCKGRRPSRESAQGDTAHQSSRTHHIATGKAETEANATTTNNKQQ